MNPSLRRLNLLVLSIAMLGSSAAYALVANDLCAPDADPCVFSGSANADRSDILDFGSRAFELADGGEIVMPSGGGLNILAGSVVLAEGSSVVVVNLPGPSGEFHIDTLGACQIDGRISSEGMGGADAGDVNIRCGSVVLGPKSIISVSGVALVDGVSVSGGGGGQISLIALTATAAQGVNISRGAKILGKSKGGSAAILAIYATGASCVLQGAIDLSTKAIKVAGMPVVGAGAQVDIECLEVLIPEGKWTISKDKAAPGGEVYLRGEDRVSIGKVKLAINGVDNSYLSIKTPGDPGQDCDVNAKISLVAAPGQTGGQISVECDRVTMGAEAKVTTKQPSSLELTASAACEIAGAIKMTHGGTFGVYCDAGVTLTAKVTIAGDENAGNEVDLYSPGGSVAVTGAISVGGKGAFNRLLVEGCGIDLSESSKLSLAGVSSSLEVVSHADMTLDGKITANPGPADLRYYGTLSPLPMPSRIKPETEPVQDGTLDSCL